MGMKFGTNVRHVNTHRLTESDFDFFAFQNGGEDFLSR